MNIGNAVGVPGQGCRNRGAAKAAQTILLPGQHPLPDSAGGCWKGVKPVGFINLEAVGSPYKKAGTRMEEGPRVSVVPTLRRVLGTGTGLVALATPEWDGKLGHSSAPQHPTAALEKAFALSPFMA